MTVDPTVIEEIVRAVLDQCSKVSEKPPVLVLDTARDSCTEQLRNHIAPGTAVVFWQPGKNAVCAADQDYERVILPCLSCSDMADLAAGRATGEIAAATLSFLLRGITVEVVDFAYRRYANTAPAALWDLYRSYEKRLAGFGLKQCQPLTAATCAIRQHLVTEKDILGFAARGIQRLTVSAQTVITALAADAARSCSIEIIRQ